jgi:hypothetical protein
MLIALFWDTKKETVAFSQKDRREVTSSFVPFSVLMLLFLGLLSSTECIKFQKTFALFKIIACTLYTRLCVCVVFSLTGNVKPWMTVHSLRSQLTRKLHTHTHTHTQRRVYRYVRYWKCIPNGTKACVCVHTVFMNGWKCAREISSSFAASSLAQATKIL